MQANENLHTLKTFIYTAGDLPKPETNKNHLRIYGHNLCPFVARARYAFAAKKVEFQHVETDLNLKAQWHKDFNGGFVPILETPTGEMFPESGILINFAIEHGGDQGYKLVPDDAIEAAKVRVAATKVNS